MRARPDRLRPYAVCRKRPPRLKAPAGRSCTKLVLGAPALGAEPAGRRAGPPLGPAAAADCLRGSPAAPRRGNGRAPPAGRDPHASPAPCPRTGGPGRAPWCGTWSRRFPIPRRPCGRQSLLRTVLCAEPAIRGEQARRERRLGVFRGQAALGAASSGAAPAVNWPDATRRGAR